VAGTGDDLRRPGERRPRGRKTRLAPYRGNRSFQQKVGRKLFRSNSVRRQLDSRRQKEAANSSTLAQVYEGKRLAGPFQAVGIALCVSSSTGRGGVHERKGGTAPGEERGKSRSGWKAREHAPPLARGPKKDHPGRKRERAPGLREPPKNQEGQRQDTHVTRLDSAAAGDPGNGVSQEESCLDSLPADGSDFCRGRRPGRRDRAPAEKTKEEATPHVGMGSPPKGGRYGEKKELWRVILEEKSTSSSPRPGRRRCSERGSAQKHRGEGWKRRSKSYGS